MSESNFDEWAAARDREVWDGHGIATLAGTYWLDAQERTFGGLPGSWSAGDSAAIGVGTGLASPLTLRPGDAVDHGELVLRSFAREGQIAVRVFEPAQRHRRGISQIIRTKHDPSFTAFGIYTATPAPYDTESVDGHRSTTTYDGIVAVDIAGQRVEITVEQLDDSTLFAAFSDATSDNDSYRFRFLHLPAPASDGRVEVDLNRAYLPPCAFSEHYVCVLPPPGNRWTIAVACGERVVR